MSGPGMRVLRCGERAVLVEPSDPAQVPGLCDSLRRDPPEGVTETVPAASTVLLRFDPAVTDADRLSAEIGGRAVAVSGPRVAETVTVPVRYDGPDLPDLARLTGLTERDVIDRHTAAEHTVAFCGFSPGFAYIGGLPPILRVPRHDTPRTAVPAGAVAVADRFTGVYPRPSPGGWRIIGQTDLPVWDLERDPPMLLRPGTRVRFVEVRT
ncbi:allophanate hydrolase subunit 1 [Actinoallomurus acanthiterrae]